MPTTEIACQLFANGCDLLNVAERGNLGPVLLGGALGGLLQPTYEKIDKNQPDPTPGEYLWGMLLGMAAAGITVYVVSPGQHTDPVRMLFFSIICGLAFPSVLASAVNTLPRRGEAVQQDIVQIAKDSQTNDLVKTEQAADNLRSTLASNPAEAIGSKSASVVDTSAQAAVQNIAETAKKDNTTVPDVINQLQQIGAVAKSAGYGDTVKAVAEQLEKLGRIADDLQAQSVVDAAVRQFRDQPPPPGDQDPPN